MKIKHVGRYVSRLNHPSSGREKAFADEWARENENSAVAAILLHRTKEGDSFSGIGVEHDGPLTQDEATKAATIIQWLGTNVGWSFLESTLKKTGYRLARVDEKNGAA